MVGSWHAIDVTGEQLYIQFQVDGKMHLASPEGGEWTTFAYRLEKEGSATYLELNFDEDWERIASVAFKGKNLIMVNTYDGETIELNPISDKQFQDIISVLTFTDTLD